MLWTAFISVILVLLNFPVAADYQEHRLKDELTRAASEGNLEKIRSLIADGADVNCCKEMGNGTPLMCAAFRGKPEAVKLLLDLGADHTLENKQGQTALFMAVSACNTEGSLKAAQILLEAGADLNVIDKAGNKAWFRAYAVPKHIFAACKPMRQLLFKYSKRRKQDAESMGSNLSRGYQGIMNIVLNHAMTDPEEMEMVLAAGGDINCCRDSNDGTPLMHAAFLKQLESVRLLLDLGADVNLQDRDGRTALNRAILGCNDKKRSLPVVELLLQRGADPTIKDREGKTPLASVHLDGCPEMRQLLGKYKR